MVCRDGHFGSGLWNCGHRSTRRLQFYVRGHPRANLIGRIVDADFYAEYLVDTFFAGLHVAREKLGLLIDLLDGAVENFLGKNRRALSFLS